MPLSVLLVPDSVLIFSYQLPVWSYAPKSYLKISFSSLEFPKNSEIFVWHPLQLLTTAIFLYLLYFLIPLNFHFLTNNREWQSKTRKNLRIVVLSVDVCKGLLRDTSLNQLGRWMNVMDNFGQLSLITQTVSPVQKNSIYLTALLFYSRLIFQTENIVLLHKNFVFTKLFLICSSWNRRRYLL
jgi:hypothetical protein